MTDQAFWDKAAPKYAKDPISDMAGYNETLGRMRSYLRPDHHVLEMGCGTGSTALLLADKVARYHGTDISPKMIEIANAKLNDEPNLSFSAAPADQIPSGYNVVIALNLLHLVPDLPSVLRAIFDSLPSGGLLMAKTVLLKDGNWFIPKVIPIMKVFGKAPSVLVLSDAQYKAALAEAGFDLIETLTQSGTVPRVFTVARKP